MTTWKIVMRIAAFAGLLVLAGVQAEASGCCAQDCTDAYGTMLNSGVPAGQAAEWYRGCLQACEEHGDPTTCPKNDAMAADNHVAPGRGVEPEGIAGATADESDPVVAPQVAGQRAVSPIPLR